MRRSVRATALAAALVLLSFPAFAQGPITYRLSFPARQHHLMNVEVTFSSLPAGALQLHMSRSSPGRYAIHEFAKNLFGLRVTDDAGHALTVTHPDPQEWDVPTHPATVHVTYTLFGDRVDGTYLAVDSTHAHFNMPAVFMWAKGLELRPITVRFDRPAGTTWRVATQLLPGADPLTWTAPNLQYLMDSPTEFSDFAERTFTVDDGGRTRTYRFTVHHDGTDAELDAFVKDVQKVVREERNVFGEYPDYEGGRYTFIADYLPWDHQDGMEHRNSTMITSSASIRTDRADLLDTVAHEFFHQWNVERIRPRSLEPFNFDDANMSGELWLAEGFTNYYGPLEQLRAGVTSLRDFLADMSQALNVVINAPGRRVHTAEEMSELAPFVDAATSIDPTDFTNTFISYYTWGSAIAFGLDLSLRERTNGRVTLDDFMRALWQKYGKPGGRLPGYVDHPYTINDARAVLAQVSGDAGFAGDFFAKYIQGHDVVDYDRLLAPAGMRLRPIAPGAAYAGALQLSDAAGGARIADVVPAGSPAYDAGFERDDVIVAIDDAKIEAARDVARVLRAHKPDDRVTVAFERHGRRSSTSMTLVEDPRVRIVPGEELGTTLTDAQRRFRATWLSSASRNAF